MANSLFWLAGVGSLLLLIPTIILVYLNWGEKVKTPLISLLLAAIVTIFVTVLSNLQESRREDKFVSPVVLDTLTSTPAASTGMSNNGIATGWHSTGLMFLGQPFKIVNGKNVRTDSPPKNDDERFIYGAELLQYWLLHQVEEVLRGGSAFGQRGTTAVAEVRSPVKVRSTVDYPASVFEAEFKKNRFANSEGEDFWFTKSGKFPLPAGTVISLEAIPTSPKTGPEKRIIRLEKPLFFKIEIGISPIGATSEGILPAGFELQPEIAKRARTFNYQIEMTAIFERLTAGNDATEEHKKWAEWLFQQLRNRAEAY